MKIFIANDHAAPNEKKELCDYIKAEFPGAEVVNLGTDLEERTNYPIYAMNVCKEVLANQGSRGILVCGSGIGMSMVANRFKGIRAALCRTVEDAKLSRGHNDANVLCLGARVSELSTLKSITKAWLKAEFEGGRHTERVALFNELGQKLE